MREELTQTVRSAIEAARIDAQQLNQEFVSTEHLMLGLLQSEGSEAGKILLKNELRPSDVRSRLLSMLPKGQQPTGVTGNLPLTPKAQRVVNSAIVKAQSLRESRVSSRFVLLALLDEPNTVMHDVLRREGADIDLLNRALLQKPAEGEA